MEPVKEPETEQEYWEAIEELGARISVAHRAASRRHTGEKSASQLIAETREMHILQKRFVGELDAKFGIIPPWNSPQDDIDSVSQPPEGKRWYWPWYRSMRKAWFAGEYEKLICSACPLSDGVERFGDTIPCSAFRGSLYQLRTPFACEMLAEYRGDWSREKLYTEILSRSGEAGLDWFLEKEQELRAAFKKTPLQWMRELQVTVLDPDGWRNADVSWDTPITRARFEELIAASTIMLVA